MREIASAIPDVEVLLFLEPEILGAKLLFLLRRKGEFERQSRPKFLFSNLISELWHNSSIPGQQHPYPQSYRDAINLALSEAWAWLVAQGLLVTAPDVLGGQNWMALSRRAIRFEDESELVNFSIARMLRKEALHVRIAGPVWSAFMRGEFDGAVWQAMKAAVREASGLSDSLLGVALMRKAFQPDDGPLTDMTAELGEREARSALFAGAYRLIQEPSLPPGRRSFRPH